MSNLYQRLCQTGELSPTGSCDHASSVRIPSIEVHGNSSSTVQEMERGIVSEDFNLKDGKPMASRGIVGSSLAWSDENYGVVAPDSKASVTSTGASPSAVGDESLLYGSLARYTGDYASVYNDDGRSSDDSSEGSKFSESFSDLVSDEQVQLKRRSSMLPVDDDSTENSEDASAFDAYIPTNLNLMDSMSFDVASHVTFDEETSLNAIPAMEDEAFQGELWVDIIANGRASRSPSSSNRNNFNKYRDMLQSSATTNSSPKEPRMSPWNTTNESDFLFSANTTALPSVGIRTAASNYLEMTKKVDERIQAMLSRDRNAMLELYQKLDHLKASTKSICGGSFATEHQELPSC